MLLIPGTETTTHAVASLSVSLVVMALPHLPTTYTTSKNIYERSIVDRRNRENEFRQKWLQNATFFKQADLTAAKKKTWESDVSFNDRCDFHLY